MPVCVSSWCSYQFLGGVGAALSGALHCLLSGKPWHFVDAEAARISRLLSACVACASAVFEQPGATRIATSTGLKGLRMTCNLRFNKYRADVGRFCATEPLEVTEVAATKSSGPCEMKTVFSKALVRRRGCYFSCHSKIYVLLHHQFAEKLAHNPHVNPGWINLPPLCH